MGAEEWVPSATSISTASSPTPTTCTTIARRRRRSAGRPAPKQERVFLAAIDPGTKECCSFRDPEPRLAGAAYTKFLFTIIYWGGDRDTVPRGEFQFDASGQ